MIVIVRNLATERLFEVRQGGEQRRGAFAVNSIAREGKAGLTILDLLALPRWRATVFNQMRARVI